MTRRGAAALPALIALAFLARSAPASASQRKLEFRVPHQFSLSDARNRVQLLLDYWHHRFGVQSHWEGNRAQVSGELFGVPFQATVVLHRDRVEAEATDPGALLRGSARDYVWRKLKKYLHPKYLES